MSRKNRSTLKSYFRNGALPTAENFRDLIDSAVNQVDDGFDKTPREGLKVKSTDASHRLLSLYNGLDAKTPAWVVEHGDAVDDAKGGLQFRSQTGFDDDSPAAPAITLADERQVGVGHGQSEWRLDVGGPVRAEGRIGGYLFRDNRGAPFIVKDEEVPGQAPANARWHDISPDLTGCQALEIVAGAGAERGKGRWSLTHAIALNAFNPGNFFLNFLFGRKRIRHNCAVYGSYGDRIRLRWRKVRIKGDVRIFRLQIRTYANYGDDVKIRFHITRLWFDEMMTRSSPAAIRRQMVTAEDTSNEAKSQVAEQAG